MQLVAIVGVDHEPQLGFFSSLEMEPTELRSLIESQGLLHRIDLIAEEMSTFVMMERSVEQSVPQIAAACLGVRHLFCDPNPEERNELEILEWAGVVGRGQAQGHGFREIESCLADMKSKREEEWLRRIRASGAQRVLLVCGHNHVATVQCKLRRLGVSFPPGLSA